MKNIVTVVFGSHLYGTNTPTSDTDFMSIHLPAANDILFQQVKPEIKLGDVRNKIEGERNTSNDIDNKSYSLDMFLKLLKEGQTQVLDMLFAPDEMIISSSELWKHIQANRSRLLTKQVFAMVRYCEGQSKKYSIKGDRYNIAVSAAKIFKEVHEKSGSQTKLKDISMRLPLTKDLAEIVMIPDKLGRDEYFYKICDRKINLTNTVKQGEETCQNIIKKYGTRAIAASNPDAASVDWKAVSHAVRVGHEALELLETGFITLPLKNRDYVLSIKQGKEDYFKVSNEIDELVRRVNEAQQKSTLPEQVDEEWIYNLVREQYQNVILTDYKA